MSDFHVSVGEQVRFSKTVGESDVYMFAGITGDLSGNHVNEQYMSKSSFGHRIAHGALLVGFMSTTSSLMIARCVEQRDRRDAGLPGLRPHSLHRAGFHQRHGERHLHSGRGR